MTEPESQRPRLARTALLLLPLQVLLRGGEALLPVALAAFFGRSDETDLYFLLAAYFVFVSGVLTAAFQDSAAVSVMVRVGVDAPERLAPLAGALLGRTLAVGGLLAFGMGSVAAGLVLFTSALPGVGLWLVLFLSLGTMSVSVRAFYVGLLNSRGAFGAHPLAAGFGTAVTWAVLLLGRHALAVRIVPVATMVGDVATTAILAGITRYRERLHFGPTLTRSEDVLRVLRLVRLEVTGTLITRVNPVLDQLMSGLARVTGGGTIVRYASDVASLPNSILQATLFPPLLTQLAREADRPETFRATTMNTLAVVVPLLAVISGALALLRRPLAALLFAHGSMDPAGVERIAALLPWALAGAAPFGALLVLARAHVAIQNSRIMPGMGVLNAACNAVFNAVLVGPLGLAGIALSTSLTYLVVAVVFWFRLPRLRDA